MIELKGKYTSAKIFADTIEEGVYQQIYDAINCPAFANQSVAIMPDCHCGAGCVVGLVATIGDWVNPSHIGVDIGCTVSMLVLDREIPEEKYADFEHKVKNVLPFGMNLQPKTIIDEKDFYKFLTKGFNRYSQMWPEMLSDLPNQVTEKWISEQLKRLRMDEGTFYKSLGTVGGGNHFIEYDVNVCKSDENFNEYKAGITFHFGSRKFGITVCDYWQNKATNPVDKTRIKELTNQLKAEWKAAKKDMHDFKSELNKVIEAEKSKFINGYLTGENLKGYLMDMCLCQLYSAYNHLTAQRLVTDIIHKYGISVVKTITSVHNFIDLEDHCIRKSSIRAYAGEEMLVPFNMRDGIAICEGLSNPEWLNSCAHGAGRKMSRSAAKKNISLDEFKETMKNVYSTTVCSGTIDEAPMAYKDTDEIKELIQETCKIKCMMVPKINIKAVTDEPFWLTQKKNK